MAGVKQELRSLSHRVDVVVDHVDEGFRRQAELLQALNEKNERRASEYETRHYEEMGLLRAALDNHGGRIRQLEDAAGRPS
jgi:hypothetical protein